MLRSPGPRRASGETEPSPNEVRALSRRSHRLPAVVVTLVLAISSVPSPLVARDPVAPAAGEGEIGLGRPPGTSDEVAAPGEFAAPNFAESTVFTGLTQPTVVEFAADGRVIVAEKSGRIRVFSSLTDTTPSTYADLRPQVHDYWDRGLLGMTLDPDFVENGRMYVAYAHDERFNQSGMTWGDTCPDPPGGTDDGCVIDGRLSVLTNGGSEDVLIEDWCQQFPSHSMSDIAFDLEGALIVSGGDGASFTNTDYGQFGGDGGSPVPANPCGDPPSGTGGTQSVPTAEGGALRSQDIRTSGDSLGLSGTVIRIDPETGDAMPDNPTTSGSENAQRIVAHGVRNAFRLAVHPVSGDLWIGDVGYGTWEEVNRVDPDGDDVVNFGWPCREGASLVPGGYGALNLCSSMSSSQSPHFAYRHDSEVVSGDGCGTGSSAISGMAFYAGGSYPDIYDNALFFADYARGCMWVMRDTNQDGTPDTGTTSHFADLAAPVNITVGPGGDLFYADIGGGTIRRIRYTGGTNGAPTADIDAGPTSGDIPLDVDFDGSGSSDPNEDPLTYAWDFGDDDGEFDDAFGAEVSHTYDSSGTYTARLLVDDGHGGTDIDQVVINAANDPPTAHITTPSASLTWEVGQVVGFSGSGTDPDQGTLPASALDWMLVIEHCPSTCHEHVVQTWNGVASGSFVAPDHDYPSHVELRLTVTDENDATDTASREVFPRTVALQVRSLPSGLTVTAGWKTAATPFTLTAIEGSEIDLSVASPQSRGGFDFAWGSWSNGGGQSHTITANASATYTATFSGGYLDVPVSSAYLGDIGWLTQTGITAGCGPQIFCPTSSVTRGQMASFLVRALGLTAGATPDRFSDIAGSAHRADINRLAAAGLTAGCGSGKFCPNAVVRRSEMASFLARALELAGPAPNAFSDDNGLAAETDINRLAQAGVTSGCAPGLFCPNQSVTREQMAAFLHRAFEDDFPET